MIKILFISFNLLILASCSSSKKTNTNLSPIDQEFSWVENNDFIPEKEIPFVPSEDNFSNSVSDEDILSSESIDRLPRPKLEDVEESNNPISAAMAFCYNGNFEKGFKIIDKNYNKYKSHPSFWNIQANCYFLKREKRKALLYYNKSLSINKNYSPALNNLGVMYWREGQYQKALLSFKKALNKSRFSLTPSFNIASLYLKFGLFKKSKDYFYQFYKRNPQDKDVVSSLGTLSLIEGKLDESIRYFESLDRRYLELPHAGLNYSLALKFKGRSRDAKSAFEDIRMDRYPQFNNYASKVRSLIRN